MVVSIQDYIDGLTPQRQLVIEKLRTQINKNLPKGFKEELSYGMIGWVVPHSIYPSGYHCDTTLPLPFLSIASQKNFVALYHMGIYASPELMEWFVSEYSNHCKTKLDMGKSCIRFKKLEDIPYDLLNQLVRKMSVEDWIRLYENNIVKK